LSIRLIAIFLVLLHGCNRMPGTHAVRIGATTSAIGAIVNEIGKDKVDVVTIVSAGMCPGHFDIKPGDITRLEDAKIILSHGFEGWVENLLSSIHAENPNAIALKLEENWMIPKIQKTAAKQITEILTEISPENRDFYERNLRIYESTIDSVVSEIRRMEDRFERTKTICSEHQGEFLDWLGFDVVATYGRPEELTPTGLLEIMRMAKKEEVRIVIDNLQSGGEAGREIAEEIGARHAVLTNFPLEGSYIASLRDNVDRLAAALSESSE
jgi:zinc transport system substrate-binding protein